MEAQDTLDFHVSLQQGGWWPPFPARVVSPLERPARAGFKELLSLTMGTCSGFNQSWTKEVPKLNEKRHSMAVNTEVAAIRIH